MQILYDASHKLQTSARALLAEREAAEKRGYERGIEDAAGVAQNWEKQMIVGDKLNAAFRRVAAAIRALDFRKG